MALLALVGGLLLAELALRALAGAVGRTRGVTYDDVLGWHMLPDVSKRGDPWCASEPARTNASGWRDEEFELLRRPGVRRLLVLGDSMTFGANVDFGQRFTELLEDDGTEVLNFGACAFGTDQQLLVYEGEARRYDADVVLLMVTVNNDLDDIRCSRKSGWSKPYFTLEGGRLQLHPCQHSLAAVLRSHSYLVELLMQLFERGVPSATRLPQSRAGDALPLFAALVQRLAREVAADGSRLLVVFERYDPGATPGLAEQGGQMLAAVRAAGVASFEMDLRAASPPGGALRLPCGHWTPQGHALVADALRRELSRRGW